jgi:hypothetical protein
MSKKIIVKNSDINRPNLSLLFHSYLESKDKEVSNYVWEDDEYADMHDYWDRVFQCYDDDYDVIYPYNGSLSKKKKHKKSRKGDNDYVSYITSDYDSEYKEIWFYPDYHCKEDRIEFNSLRDFDEYCYENGYVVTNDVSDKIIWQYESHCCLDPRNHSIGLDDIVCEHSYGELFYSVCDEEEFYNNE